MQNTAYFISFRRFYRQFKKKKDISDTISKASRTKVATKRECTETAHRTPKETFT